MDNKEHASFVCAMRRGEISAMEHYFAQPRVMEAALRAESWLAAQHQEAFQRACLKEMGHAYLAGTLWHALQTTEDRGQPSTSDSECVWFLSSNAELELHSFESREAEYDFVSWLLGSPLVKSTPQTIKWVLSILTFSAAKRGHCELLELLLESAALRDKFSGDEMSQLLEHVACAWASRLGPPQENAVDVVNVLLTHGAAVEFLQAKVDLENINFCRYLVGLGAHIVGLYHTARGWKKAVPSTYLRTIVEAGVDPRAGGPFVWRRIVTFGSVEAIAMLVEDWCADLDARDSEGATPLMVAVTREDTAATEILLDKGADVTLKDSRDATALTYAIAQGRRSVVELLLTRGADPTQVDRYGRSMLDLAAGSDPSVVKLLRQFGAT